MNGSVPAPTLRWKEGDTVTLRVANTLDEDASIHWHGILLPANMDGVPGSQLPRHSSRRDLRVSLQGAAGRHVLVPQPFGISGTARTVWSARHRAARAEPFKYDREHVVMLTDWTDENPARVFAKLKKRSDYYNFNQRTVGDFFRDVRTQGLKAALADRKMWGEMRMNPTDLADVSGLHLHISDERRRARPAIGRGSSNRASECACGSSTDRRCRTSTCGFRA